MPTITIRNIDDKTVKALKSLAKDRGIPYNSVEELLRREIAHMTRAENVSGTDLPITLYMTPALPRHYVAEREDGSRWIILATTTGKQSWASASEYKGNYDLERLPDYMAKMYLPED
ncbi:MAG: hypothetical protein JEY79_10950 [Pseudodesulfovibrio sp.]|nr:hypothetical protein [Pseudodesulfovibrio sp.]